MMLLIKEIKEILARKTLLYQLTSREIKSRYKQSILGYFWVILNPLAQMLVMSFAFSFFIRVPAENNVNYSIFLFTALLPWTLFSNSVIAGTNTLVSSGDLIKKIYFPRSILILSSIWAKIIDFFFAGTVLVVYMIIFQVQVSPQILWFIPIFIIQQILTFALCLFLATTNLFYRDIQHLMNWILLLWMYLTPIIYPQSAIPSRYDNILRLNPMANIINSYRECILYQHQPNLMNLSITFVTSIILFLICLKYFKNNEKNFADNI